MIARATREIDASIHLSQRVLIHLIPDTFGDEFPRDGCGESMVKEPQSGFDMPKPELARVRH
jgi:hypothetical protein